MAVCVATAVDITVTVVWMVEAPPTATVVVYVTVIVRPSPLFLATLGMTCREEVVTVVEIETEVGVEPGILVVKAPLASTRTAPCQTYCVSSVVLMQVNRYLRH